MCGKCANAQKSGGEGFPAQLWIQRVLTGVAPGIGRARFAIRWSGEETHHEKSFSYRRYSAAGIPRRRPRDVARPGARREFANLRARRAAEETRRARKGVW